MGVCRFQKNTLRAAIAVVDAVAALARETMAEDSMLKVFLGLPKIFLELPPATQRRLAESATVTSYKKGDVVVPGGQVSPPVIALRSGLLVLSFASDDDTSTVSDFVRPLEVFGMSTRPRMVSAGELSAVSSSTAVLWPVEEFREALLASAAFAVWYLDSFERRLAHHYLHSARVVKLSSEARYAYFLWTMSEPLSATRRVVKVKIPQHFIASYLGIGREQVSRHNGLLARTGHLVKTKNGLELLDDIVHLFSLEDAGIPLGFRVPFAS